MLSRFALLFAVVVSGAIAQISDSEYSALQSEFQSMHGSTIFPVAGKTFDDIDSTFGPRHQHSTDRYDFHRGIDVDGTEGDDILAITGGRFWEYRNFSAGGHTVILQHDFSSPMTLNGTSYDHYYTYYMHLYDDGIEGNGIGTLDLISGWTEEKGNANNGTQIAANQHIGELGNSGSSGGAEYADHLHLEVRVGTTNSLIYQTDNPGSTQHGFDPHLHPLLFFEPETFGDPAYTPTLSSESVFDGNSDVEIVYETPDESPLLNRVEVTLRDGDSNAILDSHVLDYNLRTGFDATDINELDDQKTDFSYIEPVEFGDNSTTHETGIAISQEWFDSATGSFTLEVSAFDIWGNETQFSVQSVPEPRAYALLLGIGALMLMVRRRNA